MCGVGCVWCVWCVICDVVCCCVLCVRVRFCVSCGCVVCVVRLHRWLAAHVLSVVRGVCVCELWVL